MKTFTRFYLAFYLAIFPSLIWAFDVPPGDYLDITEELGKGDRDASYTLLGNTILNWRTQVLGGMISIGANALTVETGGGNMIELNGVISGSGSLLWIGGGRQVEFQNLASLLGGKAANLATGTLTLERGTLSLNKPTGVTAWAGPILIGGGSNQATLQWQHSHQVADGASVQLTGAEGGRLRLGGYSDSVGTLQVTGDGDIFLGRGRTILKFAASAGQPWTPGKQLIIREWSGLISGGGTEQICFGNSAGGLNPTQLAQTGFINPVGLEEGLYHAALLASGELVPTGRPITPLSSPWDLGAAAVAARTATYTSHGLLSLTGGGTPLPRGLSISVFGDSITWLSNEEAPFPASPLTPNPINDFQRNNHWFNLLGRQLTNPPDAQVQLYNHAINGGGALEIETGRDTADGNRYLQPPLATFLALDGTGALVISIGINDACWRDTSAADFKISLKNMVRSAQTARVPCVLATPALYGELPSLTNPCDPAIDTLCAVTRAVCTETGATLVDLRKVFLAWEQNNNYQLRLDGTLVSRPEGLLTYDGLHPSDAGAVLIANHLAGGIYHALSQKAAAGPKPVIDRITFREGALFAELHDEQIPARDFLVETSTTLQAGDWALEPRTLFSQRNAQASEVVLPVQAGRRFFRMIGFAGTTPSGPVLIAAPLSTSVYQGSPATLSVSARGSGLFYQWSHCGRDLLGAERPVLEISSARPVHAGAYAVKVFNAAGAVVSAPAELTVYSTALPSLFEQPEDRVAPLGTSITLSVRAGGTPSASYQWMLNDIPLAGATAPNLRIHSMTPAQAGAYTVRVRDSGSGASVTSVPARVALPSISADLVAADEFTGTSIGWLEDDPAPQAEGFGLLNGEDGNYSSRPFSATPLTGEVWLLFTLKMESTPESYYTLSPGNTCGEVQMFSTGFDPAYTPNAIHQLALYTETPATQIQTFLYKISSSATATTYKGWVAPGIGMDLDPNTAPWSSGSVDQEMQGVNSYYRSFGSAAGHLLVERVLVGRSAAAVLPAPF